VAFYVPLGPRGGIFRLGILLNDLMGGVAYRLSCRRRDRAFRNPTLPRPLVDALHAD